MTNEKSIDSTRASRDGHEFHEAWTARKALELLQPESEIAGIAVEGLAPVDQSGASAATVAISDIAIYYGDRPSFADGARTALVQFKYSIADKDTEFRASRARRTITKFANAFSEYRKQYGPEAVSERLTFRLITNQPIYEPLLKAVEGIGRGQQLHGVAKSQGAQFARAAGLEGDALASFAASLSLVGHQGSLRGAKDWLENLVVDWSASNGALSQERLGRLRELVRDKAGYAGTRRNLITRPDLLAALGVSDAADLLPCKARRVDVGPLVEREQLSSALALVDSTELPLVVHAAGGVGKTVFMQSLERELRKTHEVVSFDCFAGGAYRSADDARHLAEHGLVHIANTLSFRGRCDPILPNNPDVRRLLRTFRRRLVQCVSTIHRVAPNRRVVLLIDAVDNAEHIATQRGEHAFPIQLMESLHEEPLDGVRLVLSCRSHRKPQTYAEYQSFELAPFNRNETRCLLQLRLEHLAEEEVNVAQARSGGNPRVLDYLLRSGEGLVDATGILEPVKLPTLLQQRIDDSLDAARRQGAKPEDLEAFLAGLAILPPPVPLDEYAGIHGIDLSAVESFATDMAPMLDRTNQGLIFRDEPTEQLVLERYATKARAVRRVADGLMARQDRSAYAARALPRLLHELDETEALFHLAFDERIPSAVTSTVGRRNIRHARLLVATRHAARKRDYNWLVRLLVELSTLAAGDQRGANYVLANPDLVVAALDDDAMRRLFEARSGWPGTRHARLVVANTLTREHEEAHRHMVAAREWINHWISQPDDARRPEGPEAQDIAAIPLLLVTNDRGREAAQHLSQWYDWYGFEVCGHVFRYSILAQSRGAQSSESLRKFVDNLKGIGPIAAALSFCRFSVLETKDLLGRLHRLCRRATRLQHSRSYHRSPALGMATGLQRASALALSLGMPEQARTISLRAPHDRPKLWTFQRPFERRPVFSYIYRTALMAAAKRRSLHEKDLLPTELFAVSANIPRRITGQAFREKLADAIGKTRLTSTRDRSSDASRGLTNDERSSALRFVRHQLSPLLQLARSLSEALGGTPAEIDQRFVGLVDLWQAIRNPSDRFGIRSPDRLLRSLGLEALLLILWSRPGLTRDSVQHFVRVAQASDLSVGEMTRITSLLAGRPALMDTAGDLAQRVSALIRSENDVTTRAQLYSTLARALLPASVDEASHYFRVGLEQLDAIGSGDRDFAEELLHFAGEIRGGELGERDFHTLGNIAELNLGEEPYKFFWQTYGRAMANVSGTRGLARLSRWDDRGRATLDATLLPFLVGLLEQGKISATDAIALNRLASPAEYYDMGTARFADAIRQSAGADPEAIAAIIGQYRDNTPGLWSESAARMLSTLAQEAFGPSSELARELLEVLSHHGSLRDRRNRHSSGRPPLGNHIDEKSRDPSSETVVRTLAEETDPVDERSLAKALAALDELDDLVDRQEAFFSQLRARVDYQSRSDYLRQICGLEQLRYHGKLAELNRSKEAWASSSAALGAVLESLAEPLVRQHADDLFFWGQVSRSSLNEISELTGVPTPRLVLLLIEIYAHPRRGLPGPAWLGLGTSVCSEAEPGHGRAALTRLLGSEAAELANSVPNEAWVEGLYPGPDTTAAAAGLVWRALGSPFAETRWRAAHSVRDFAAFGNWAVVDSIVEQLFAAIAGPFQAPELKFYYRHARLWLLIALARLAHDQPQSVGRYKDKLLRVLGDRSEQHVLIRHLAARAMQTCASQGAISLTPLQAQLVSEANASPFRRHAPRNESRRDSYHGRSGTEPEPKFDFALDYDFRKYDVDGLARVFGKDCWEVSDAISTTVEAADADVTSMHDTDGRELRPSRAGYGLTERVHGYGQQLAWHALFIVAGQLLGSNPVCEDEWSKDPWRDWLDPYLLTRPDGLWLSDGTDATPSVAHRVLLGNHPDGDGIASDRNTFLDLAGITGTKVERDLTIWGRWYTTDHVRVEISSALVPQKRSAELTAQILREDPFVTWLPTFDQTEDSQRHQSKKAGYIPWILRRWGEDRLDRFDPFGSALANWRPSLARRYRALLELEQGDPFGREWLNGGGEVVLRAEAWGRSDNDDSKGARAPGSRLQCSPAAVERVLRSEDLDLLLLINLQRYERHHGRSDQYRNSVAAVLVRGSLDVEYHSGKDNHVHATNY